MFEIEKNKNKGSWYLFVGLTNSTCLSKELYYELANFCNDIVTEGVQIYFLLSFSNHWGEILTTDNAFLKKEMLIYKFLVMIRGVFLTILYLF